LDFLVFFFAGVAVLSDEDWAEASGVADGVDDDAPAGV